MPASSAPERLRLAGPGLLLAIAAAGVAALVALHEPRRLLVDPLAPQAVVDEVAVAWLRSALAHEPDNGPLRLRLAHAWHRLGRVEQARATLEPLLARPGRLGTQARLLELRLATPNLALQRRKAEALGAEALEPAEREELYRLALALGQPAVAAAQAEALAAGQPLRWGEEAGRQWLAAGEPLRAAEAWARAASSAQEEPQAVRLALQALSAARQAPPGARAVAVAEALLAALPPRAELLAAAVEVALAHGALARAERWAARRAALVPGQVEAWQRWGEVALAAGSLPGALQASLHQARLRPAEARPWRHLAQVAGWAGAPGTALKAWHHLALWHTEPGAAAQALQLARALGHVRTEAELLSSLARQGALEEAQWQELARAWERLGEPRQAEALLRGAGRAPLLAQVLERQGRLEEALATWEAWAPAHAPAEARGEALRAQAELLWRLGRAREALARLRQGLAQARPYHMGCWRLLAELAWHLGEEEEARAAYQALAQAAPGEPEVARRLAQLALEEAWQAEQQGHQAEAHAAYERALALGERGWAVWLARARVLEAAGRAEEARQALREALQHLRPQQQALLSRLPAPEAVEQVLPAVQLADRLGGVPEAEEWARALEERAAGSEPVQAQALARALAQGSPQQVRHWAGRMQRSGRRPPAWVLLRLAWEAGEEAELARVLEERGEELSLADRVAAQRRLGREEHAWALLTSTPWEERPEPERAALAVHARELGEPRRPRVRVEAAAERWGALQGVREAVQVQAGGPGPAALRARAGHRHLEESGRGARVEEVEAAVQATLGPEQRAGGLELGLLWRSQRLQPTARVWQQWAPPRHPLRLRAEAAWSEPAEETEQARLWARRHRLSGTLELELPGALQASATAELKWHRAADTHARLAEGVGGSLRLGRSWAHAGWGAELYAAGGLGRSWPQPTAVYGLLPEQVGSVGLGGAVGTLGPGRLQGRVAAWAGWLWPEQRPGYRLQGSLGVELGTAGRLVASASHGQGLPGAGAWHSVELAWEYRFGMEGLP